MHIFRTVSMKHFQLHQSERPCLRWGISWSLVEIRLIKSIFSLRVEPLRTDQGQASGSSQPTLVGSRCRTPSLTNDILIEEFKPHRSKADHRNLEDYEERNRVQTRSLLELQRGSLALTSYLGRGGDIPANSHRLCVTGLSLSRGICYDQDSKLDQTRFHGPLFVSANSTFHFISMWS